MLKNKIAFIVSIALFTLSCNNSDKKITDSTTGKFLAKNTDSLPLLKKGDSVKGELMEPDFIKNKVLANHAKITNTKGNVNAFKQYLITLDTHKLESIAFAMDYIKTCTPLGDTLAQDSIYLCFRSKFYDIVNSYPDSMYQEVILKAREDTSGYENHVFKDNLNQCGVAVFFTEGQDYYSEQPDYFYNNFKDRVSGSVREYLSLREEELKEGFSEDAGLLISFADLYKRTKNWERFLLTYPNSILNGEALSLYKEYLETLLTGMDNSRVFDMQTNILTPEVKKLYEKIMKDDPTSRTTKIISSYYKLLAQHSFVGYDSVISPFIKGDSLNNMIGVQPMIK